MKNKNEMRNIFDGAKTLGLNNISDFNSLVNKQTIVMESTTLDDPGHFVYAYLEQLL